MSVGLLRALAWQAAAWRTWCEYLSRVAAARNTARTTRGRLVSSLQADALALWRAHALAGRRSTHQLRLARRTLAQMIRREIGRAFRALEDAARTARVQRERLRRARRARARWRMARCWTHWLDESCRRRETGAIFAAAVGARDSRGRRRVARRALDHWRCESRWRGLVALAAARWRAPSILTAFRAVEAVWRRCLLAAEAAARIARRRGLAALGVWSAATATARGASALTTRSLKYARRSMLQHAVVAWRSRANAVQRAQLREARSMRAARLGAAAQLVQRAMKRNALHALAQQCSSDSRRSAAALALGRCIGHIECQSTLSSWHRYAQWEHVMLARAADAFPALHRRTHLLRWRATVAATNRRRAKGAAAFARWLNGRLARALFTWVDLSSGRARTRKVRGWPRAPRSAARAARCFALCVPAAACCVLFSGR